MKPPNLLVLLTDQQRFDTIGALGNSAIRTPYLDRLVREGTAFTSAYAPAAECVPSRCCLTFGQYPGRTGCYSNGFPMPWDTKDNVMAALGRHGYLTHGIGKCHFTPESRKTALNGFTSRERQEEIVDRPEDDEYLTFLQSNGGGHITDPHGVRGEMYYIPQPAQMPAALHPTQWVGDRSEAFLRDPARREQPWYLFSSFIHPHPPFCPPAPWHKLYRELEIALPHTPDDCEKLLVMVNHQQNRMKRRDRGWDINLVRMIRAYYYASISFIDFQIGRILTALEETGQLDNTLIVFSSDHGELLGDFRSFGKRSYHDPASRIPMLLRGPGVEPGGRCDVPVSLLDVTATLLAQSGAEFSTHQPDGADLVALAQNPPEDRCVFSQLNRAGDGLYMAVNKRWKFVYSAPDRRQLLFDRRSDPGETTDLGAATWDASWPTQQAQNFMRGELIKWLTEQGEEAALEEGKLRLYPKREMPANPDSWLLYQDHPWAEQFIQGYSTSSET